MPRCFGTRDQSVVGGLRQFEPLQHGELAFRRIGGALLIVRLARRMPGQRIGVEGLEFDDVGAGIRGRVDKGEGGFEAAGMIDAGFGDDERAMPVMAPLAGRDIVKALFEQCRKSGMAAIASAKRRWIRRRHRD